MTILKRWLERKGIKYVLTVWGISFCAFGMDCNVWEHPEGSLCYSAFDKESKVIDCADKVTALELIEHHLMKMESKKKDDEFISRVQKEYMDLAKKYNKIVSFRHSEKFSDISEVQQYLIEKQIVYMKEYLDVLRTRLHDLNAFDGVSFTSAD